MKCLKGFICKPLTNQGTTETCNGDSKKWDYTDNICYKETTETVSSSTDLKNRTCCQCCSHPSGLWPSWWYYVHVYLRSCRRVQVWHSCPSSQLVGDVTSLLNTIMVEVQSSFEQQGNWTLLWKRGRLPCFPLLFWRLHVPRRRTLLLWRMFQCCWNVHLVVICITFWLFCLLRVLYLTL